MWQRLSLSGFYGFQSTHPRGVRLMTEDSLGKIGRCFNPRTRVGCDTVAAEHGEQDQQVSIHAPAWGATCRQMRPHEVTPGFQSTHPRGVRPVITAIYPSRNRRVSIHAPAWGATLPTIWLSPPVSRFNPRTRVGCDGFRISTLPGMLRFNPRTRVGCDGQNFSPCFRP